MAAVDTPLAQVINIPSVRGLANRASSTTLSTPSSPEENASESCGDDSGAWAAWIDRLAFHWEIPYRIDRK